MPDESWPTRTNREPHGNFSPPFRRAREQQTGKVHAREQKHERTNRHEHSSKGEDRVRDVGNEQAGFPEPNAASDILRIILGKLRGQRLKRGLRLSKRHAGFQPPDREEIIRVALVDPGAPRLDRLRHHYRDEHLRVVGDFSANKSFRRDADNGE